MYGVLRTGFGVICRTQRQLNRSCRIKWGKVLDPEFANILGFFFFRIHLPTLFVMLHTLHIVPSTLALYYDYYKRPTGIMIITHVSGIRHTMWGPHPPHEWREYPVAWRLKSHFSTWHGVVVVTGLKRTVTVRRQPAHYSANMPFTPVPSK